METEANKEPQTKLELVAAEDVKKSFSFDDPATIQALPGEDAELENMANRFVAELVYLNPDSRYDVIDGINAMETLGLTAQKEAVSQSDMLKQPLHEISNRSDDSGDVGGALLKLREKVEEIAPDKFNFEPGWPGRLMAMIPGVGTPIKRYFDKYSDAQTVITDIVRALGKGREQLQRDNITLRDDQQKMRETIVKLERAIKLGQLIDKGLQVKLEVEIPKDDNRVMYVNEGLIFNLRQRIIDLQQQIAVAQQGIIAMELIIRNNMELMKGVDRSINVTVTALQVAVTVAMALANQKITLDRIEAVSQTTSDLIAGTAERLKTQGAQIHKQAASAQINMDSLKKAFADIDTAIMDITQFRSNALPQMAAAIGDMEKTLADASQKMAVLDYNKGRDRGIIIEAK